MAQVFLRVLRFSPVSSTPSMFHTHKLTYQKDKRAQPGMLPKSTVLSEIGENEIEKYFHLFRL